MKGEIFIVCPAVLMFIKTSRPHIIPGPKPAVTGSNRIPGPNSRDEGESAIVKSGNRTMTERIGCQLYHLVGAIRDRPALSNDVKTNKKGCDFMDMKEYIREFTLKDIVKVRNPKVSHRWWHRFIGDPPGLHHTNNLTAIVTVGDDGGGSREKLREELGILPPGDIRSCILALADDENVMQELFSYRFHGGPMAGQSFGNLFLAAAMNGISHDFYDAVRRTSDVLQIREVLPVHPLPDGVDGNPEKWPGH